ncbi:MAG: AMP-binding protein [Novosphingobium sp.]|nr:AMP-binding protein [Novosphingobium sp.]
MAPRVDMHGWSLRHDEALARIWREQGWWCDETMGQVARRLALNEPDRTLIVDGEVRLTVAQVVRDAENIAQHFLARGIGPGKVVSFMLPNWHEAAAIYLACSLTGAVAHPIVPQLRDSEVAFMLVDGASRLIFVPAEFRGFDYRTMMDRVNAGRDDPVETVVLRGGPGGHTPFAALIESVEQPQSLPVVDPDSVKMLMYTSGTTGRPKGVLHSHNSLHALIRQIQKHWHVEPGDSFFVPSPISHIGGSIYAFEIPLLCGTTAVLQEQWDPVAAVAAIDRERCTHMAGATPFLDGLLGVAELARSTLASLKVFICGGASVPPGLVRRAQVYFEKAAVSRVYGSTEVPVLTVGSLEPGEEDMAAETDGRIGIAEVRLVAEEVTARGPQMLRGYLHREDEAEAFTEDGFFRMGDLAREVEGGYLVITGRAKDIIIRNGENIAPKEIEDLLIDHPSIADITVVGLPDQRTGERACAVIVPSGDSAPDRQALGSFLGERGVAKFKWPEQVELRKELPRNAAGKVLKHVLQKELSGAG